MGPLYASRRSASIEYAIRDIVVPATELERKGHELIKLNIGDPLSYPGLPTPPHMVEAFKGALENQRNGYGPSYGIEELRVAIANDEVSKGWGCEPKDVYVTHGVTEALQVLFAAFLRMVIRSWPRGPLPSLHGLPPDVWRDHRRVCARF